MENRYITAYTPHPSPPPQGWEGVSAKYLFLSEAYVTDLTTSKNNGIAFGVFDNAFTDRVEQKVLHLCFTAGAEYD